MQYGQIFSETNSLSETVNNFRNISIVVYLNNNTLSKARDSSNHLNFSGTLNLNKSNQATIYTKGICGTYFYSPNKPKCFHQSAVTIGLSYCHKQVLKVLDHEEDTL